MSDRKSVPSSKELNLVYDEGYFHGSGSGYSTQGYEHDHADWTRLIRWIKSFAPNGARWLDLGCAYGYLVEQANAEQFVSVGLDISWFALGRLPQTRGRLLQSLVETLPFQDHVFDVVSIFDVVEHIVHLDLAFDEIERVIKPGGLCLLSTPDPIYFHRNEPTHANERPPAFWVETLRQRGWQVGFRFGNLPYEFELIACRQPGDTWRQVKDEFQHRSHSFAHAVRVSGGDLEWTIRTCERSDAGPIRTSIYALNPCGRPQRISVSLESTDERHPEIFLKDLKLSYTGHERDSGTILHRWGSESLPPGGHELIVIEQTPAEQSGRLLIESRLMDPTLFLSELAFDHYQRYQSVTLILNQLGSGLSVLDAGGALGYLPLFAPKQKVTVLDRVPEDCSYSWVYKDDRFPFDDESFDIALAVDTLEHIESDRRERFLEELCRVSRRGVILCGPFEDPLVAESEEILRGYLKSQFGKEDRFLNEHSTFGLPDRRQVIHLLQSKGYALVEYPNGYLPRWLAMQMILFSLTVAPELHHAKKQINRLYNLNFFEDDHQVPAYRYVAVALKGDQPALVPPSLPDRLSSADPNLWSVAGLIASLSMISLIRDKESYLSSQGLRIDRLLDHIQNVQTDLLEERKQREALLNHTVNLDSELNNRQTEMQSLLNHIANLEELIKTQVTERESLQQSLRQVQQHNTDLVTHSENLIRSMKEWESHAKNLELQSVEFQKHIHNLEAQHNHDELRIRNLEEQARQLQEQIVQLQEQIRTHEELRSRCEAQISDLGAKSNNLEAIIEELTEERNRMLEYKQRLAASYLYKLKLLKDLPPIEESLDV